MLPPQLDYATAKARYHPFNRLIDPRPDLRAEVARLAVARLRADQDVLVIVNNKAEGSAPLSIMGLAEAITARSRPTLGARCAFSPPPRCPDAGPR